MLSSTLQRKNHSEGPRRLYVEISALRTASAPSPRTTVYLHLPLVLCIMGAGQSSLLVEEIEEISATCKLSSDEVQHLYQRFQKLDRAKRGKLSGDALMMIPELAMNPLAERIASLFEDANFHQFVELLSVFGRNADPDLKRMFLFRVYDMDGDGFVSKEDLRTVMRMLLGDEHLSESQLEQLAESVIKNADTDNDGRISKEEFAGAVDLDHVRRHCTINL